MKRLLFALLTISILNYSCKPTGSMVSIEPKSGGIELPAKGEFRMWRNTIHPGFSVTLTNPSATQSCEVYKVTANGNEKWISPSLLAGSSLTVTVPANGYLLLNNYNGNTLKIDYTVKE